MTMEVPWVDRSSWQSDGYAGGSTGNISYTVANLNLRSTDSLDSYVPSCNVSIWSDISPREVQGRTQHHALKPSCTLAEGFPGIFC
jgi:hypothetical protein